MRNFYLRLLLLFPFFAFANVHAYNGINETGTTEASVVEINAPEATLNLLYPNGGNIMEVGKTLRLEWEGSGLTSDVKIEFSSNNGTAWTQVASVGANQKFYDFKVPNKISKSCKIRISSEGVRDTSGAAFSVIANDDLVYRIVVLGSSTAEGIGPDDINDAWVNLYREYLLQLDSRFEVINLGRGGYTTYDILPTGSTIPSGVNRNVDPTRNVTQALSLNPGGIIINMPSNDAAYGYPAQDQLDNYEIISELIADQNIPLWVTTPQPRDFGSNTRNRDIQLEMLDATYEVFDDMAIDFWTGFVQSNNNGILPQFDSGDGVHMNAAGHQILFDRVVDKGIGERVKKNTDDLSVENGQELKTGFQIYPNPVSDRCTIQLSQAINDNAVLTVYDLLGKVVYKQEAQITAGATSWSKGSIKSGMYILQVAYGQKINAQRLIVR